MAGVQRSQALAQADLFGEPESKALANYTPKPEHLRNRLVDFVTRMRAAGEWPWAGTQLALYRDTVWPYLLRLLPDRDEAERWRGDLDVEAARLDKAASSLVT
jgi:hypothetical protein